MNRNEIIQQVHIHIDHFREGWDDFCRWVEGCAEELAKHQNQQRKHDGWVFWAIPGLGRWANAPEWIALNLPDPEFYAPADAVNPLLWLLPRDVSRRDDADPLLRPNPRKATSEEQDRLAIARLCIAHDSDPTLPQEADRICRRDEPYGGTYFDRDRVYDLLAGGINDSDLEYAWGRIEGYLLANPKAERKEPRGRWSAEARAMAVLAEHPDWTDKDIAKEAGINRTTLYKCRKYMTARKVIREQGRKSLAQGSKDGETGDMEAWDPDD